MKDEPSKDYQVFLLRVIGIYRRSKEVECCMRTFSLSLIQSVPPRNVLIIGSGYIAMVVTQLYNYRNRGICIRVHGACA